MRGEEILYLSHDDVVRCAVTPDEITCAVEKAFRAKALGRAATNRKLTLPAGPEANFAGKGGVLLDEGYAAVKWYGYIGNNARRGLPDFSPLLILSSTETGLPLAVLDGRWITAVRTASITAVAATVLAKPHSRSAGFVACGTQAEANLWTLRARFALERVVAYSRNRDTAERFAAEGSRAGADGRGDLGSERRDPRPRHRRDERSEVLGADPLPRWPRGCRRSVRVNGGPRLRMGRGAPWVPLTPCSPTTSRTAPADPPRASITKESSLRISASFLRSRRNGRTTAWLGAPSSLPGPAFRTWRLRPSCIAAPSKAMRGGSCLAEELRSLRHRAARARSLVASTARPFGARANRVGAYGPRSRPGVSPVISRATARALGGPPVIPKWPWPNAR